MAIDACSFINNRKIDDRGQKVAVGPENIRHFAYLSKITIQGRNGFYTYPLNYLKAKDSNNHPPNWNEELERQDLKWRRTMENLHFGLVASRYSRTTRRMNKKMQPSSLPLIELGEKTFQICV
jgi:hypothetical protein